MFRICLNFIQFLFRFFFLNNNILNSYVCVWAFKQFIVFVSQFSLNNLGIKLSVLINTKKKMEEFKYFSYFA